jgi:hypothetical protein
MQAELAACKAQLHRKTSEVTKLHDQNIEIVGELAWVVKDLLRLKKLENEGRCMAWLEGSKGLSTVLKGQTNSLTHSSLVIGKQADCDRPDVAEGVFTTTSVACHVPEARLDR